jgi:hypothetical protein
MDLQSVRNNVDFRKSEGTVTFNLYNDFSFNEDQSCSDCDINDKVYAPNVPYLALFSNAQNEGSLLLSMTCTTTQLALMKSNPTSQPFCAPAQLNNPTANCVCCSPTGASGAIPCSSLLTQTTKPAGIISWLAKYDNTLKLRNAATAFALANEIYTPLVRHISVSEVIFGTVSSLLGLFRTTEAIKGADYQTLYANANTTADLRDACLDLCPTVTQVKQRIQFALANSQPLSSVNYACHGEVPYWENLNATLGSTRAQELRYLEGVSCKPFSVTLAINALLLVDPSATKVCADGSAPTATKPCCMKAYQSTTFGLAGGGLGCLFWVNGLVQSRRVYSDEEAVAYLKPSPETQVSSLFPLHRERGVVGHDDDSLVLSLPI